MALFKKLKYAFGLESDDYEDLVDDETSSDNKKEASARPGVTEPQRALSQPSVAVEIDDNDATSKIFEHVVDTFNKSLPDFLKQTVDAGAERKYLYDTLSSDLKQYLADIAERTQRQCQESWNADKERLQKNVQELEQKAKAIEEQREELSQKQLSAERQRRALSDRVVDLEKQVMTFEAEREQFQLENKSLVNKLKVASVTEKDIDAMRDEITRLQEELNQARQQNLAQAGEVATEPVDNDNSAEVEALFKQVSDLEAQLKAATENSTSAAQEIEELKAKISEADAMTKELGEIEAQIEQFEQVKAKKDARINDLTLELAQANETIALLKETVNKYSGEKAETEQKLKREVEQLKAKLEEAGQTKTEPVAAEKPAEPRRKSVGGGQRNRVDQSSHIDDILSDTDWLVAPSSLKSNKNTQNTSNHSNNQNRQEKNDAQMTLF
jgi:DNA repair exonuclease SbcCD ATPase subunit